MENLALESLSGLTTRWIVAGSTSFVIRLIISPVSTTICAGVESTGSHDPSRSRSSSPLSVAPTSNVIKFISPWAAAPTRFLVSRLLLEDSECILILNFHLLPFQEESLVQVLKIQILLLGEV